MKGFTKNIPEKSSSFKQFNFFQAKLSVNKPNDRYEQEANLVSEKILISESVNTNHTFFKPSVHVKNKIQRQEKAPESEYKEKEETVLPDEFDPRIDFFEMTRPFYNRGAASMLYFDDRIGNSVGYAWDNNYNLFFNFGFGDSLSADAANFFTPFTIDSALKHDFPNASEIFEKDADISSIVLSPTVLSFDIQDIPGTIRLPFLNIFGAGQPNPYAVQRKIQRKCKDCEEEEIQRKENHSRAVQVNADVENYVGNLNSGGKNLSKKDRNFFEPRFGYDFSDVKIHDNAVAAKSAASINALAYTSGNNIVFNQNQYSPETDSGKKLLAHELTHVIQQDQNINSKKIQRATVTVNEQPVELDYGNIIYEDDYPAGIQTLITSFTGAAPVPSVISKITSLSKSNQEWLLFALDVLIDNTKRKHSSLNKAEAINRLITFTPSATTKPLGSTITDATEFAKEVLIAAGWTDVALTHKLKAPGTSEKKIIDKILNPPSTGGISPGPLKVSVLKSKLVPALTTLLKAIDPANRTSVVRQSVSDIQGIGDIILNEAKTFYSPYSDASRTSVFNVNPSWTASANISDTTKKVPTRDIRLGYLENRAQIVGWNSKVKPLLPEINIFADSNFDGNRIIDETELFKIIDKMEKDPVIQPIVNRLIQHTGFKKGTGITTHIGIDPEFDAATKTECEARWKTIDTLCHEVLHALVHPDFQNASTKVSFGQVIREGFTEVLGNQLFNDHVIPKADKDPVFKSKLEVGIVFSLCGSPAKGTIGYGSAGPGADTIRVKAGDENFKAAYFLGRTDLVGF